MRPVRPVSARAHGPAAVTAPTTSVTSASGGGGAAPPPPAAGGTRVQVAVRVRPFTASDMSDAAVAVRPDPDAPGVIAVDDGKRGRSFTFDHLFTGDQNEVYQGIGVPMMEEVYNGFNVCLFAYGQTGSGKTYSLHGGAPDTDAAGIVPRFVTELFARAQRRVEEDDGLTIKVSLSFLEVYMERIRDLLATTTDKSTAAPAASPVANTSFGAVATPTFATPRQPTAAVSSPATAGSTTPSTSSLSGGGGRVAGGVEAESLELHEDADRRVFVRGLGVHSVLGVARAMELLRIGNENRQRAETRMNEHSSRSHAVLQITVSQLYDSGDRRDLESTVSIVDLAGSERQGKTESVGLQFEEAKKINQSLLALGRAIKAFGEGRDSEFVSLRDSKLTRLLSECFGGNSKTWMLATVAPSAFNLTESLSTLEYATNAKLITNRAHVNRRARHLELLELKEAARRLEAALGAARERRAFLEQRLVGLAEEARTCEAQALAHAQDASNSSALNGGSYDTDVGLLEEQRRANAEASAALLRIRTSLAEAEAAAAAGASGELGHGNENPSNAVALSAARIGFTLREVPCRPVSASAGFDESYGSKSNDALPPPSASRTLRLVDGRGRAAVDVTLSVFALVGLDAGADADASPAAAVGGSFPSAAEVLAATAWKCTGSHAAPVALKLFVQVHRVSGLPSGGAVCWCRCSVGGNELAVRYDTPCVRSAAGDTSAEIGTARCFVIPTVTKELADFYSDDSPLCSVEVFWGACA